MPDFHQYLDKEQELDIPSLQIPDKDLTDDSNTPVGPGKQLITSAMSKISGIRKLKQNNSIPLATHTLPDYGIEVPKKEELSKVPPQLRLFL